ncbi:MAG: hypothetical protein J6V40_05320 [Clostridia bacterium]|nr:hypothetical protein [Clostridia bacterium]
MSKNTSGYNWRGFMNLVAFIAMCCIGVALVFGKIFPSVASAFDSVAKILAYLITAVSAFYFVRNKRNTVYYIVWAVVVVLIVVLMLL